MSKWFNRSCPSGFFLVIMLAGSYPLWAQQIDQDLSIDVEEYDISVELWPSQQKLQAVATLKFSPIQARLSRIFLDFNANLSVKRIYFSDRPLVPGSVLQRSSRRRVTSGQDQNREGVPYLSRRRPAPKLPSTSGVPAPNPIAQDSNLLEFYQDFDQHLLEVQFPRWLESGQTASLVIEYEGRLFSAEHSPVYGVTTARVSEKVCYLLAVSR